MITFTNSPFPSQQFCRERLGPFNFHGIDYSYRFSKASHPTYSSPTRDLQHQDSKTVGMHVVLVLVTNNRQFSDLRIVPYTNEMCITPIAETVRQTTITCLKSEYVTGYYEWVWRTCT